MPNETAGTRGEVTIYSTTWCPWCDRAKAMLARRGVEYTDVNIEKWNDPRGELERLSGRRTVPQIFVGVTHVGGFDDLAAFDTAGALPALLQAEGVPVRA